MSTSSCFSYSTYPPYLRLLESTPSLFPYRGFLKPLRCVSGSSTAFAQACVICRSHVTRSALATCTTGGPETCECSLYIGYTSPPLWTMAPPTPTLSFSKRWNLNGQTALVTGGTKGLGCGHAGSIFWLEKSISLSNSRHVGSCVVTRRTRMHTVLCVCGSHVHQMKSIMITI